MNSRIGESNAINMDSITISTYIINLPERTDRRAHIENQFANRREFEVIVVEAIKHNIGAIGLWLTLRKIAQIAIDNDDDVIIVCEDDHEFTEHYSRETLFECIANANNNNADIMCGGISWFSNAVQINNRLLWVEKFTGLQFTVVFKKFFKIILEADFGLNDAADLKISDLTDNKFFVFPYISIQKDYGYSDVTAKNNTTGRVRELFENSAEAVEIIKKISGSYASTRKVALDNFNNIAIPTYVINLSERIERRLHIEKQFAGRTEFDVLIVEACKHEIGAVGLWQSIRKIVQMAVDNDDDVIIICEDDHEFTEDYDKEYLIQNIIEAGEQGVLYLSGGTSKFTHAVPVTENRYWVRSCLATQFITLYKPLFNRILNEPFDNTIAADLLLSEITSNKMILHPFISVQKDFGYSDVTEAHNINKELVSTLFNQSDMAMKKIKKIHKHE